MLPLRALQIKRIVNPACFKLLDLHVRKLITGPVKNHPLQRADLAGNVNGLLSHTFSSLQFEIKIENYT